MKLTHSVLSLTLAAGLAGSVAAYRATAGEVAPAPPRSAARTSSTPAPQVVLPGTRFGWAPCKPGSHLERGTCVTEVVRTVVVPAAVSATQAATGSGPVRGSGQQGESDGHESGADEPEGDDGPDGGSQDAGDVEGHEGHEDGEDHGDEDGEDHEDGDDDEDSEDSDDEDGEDHEDEDGEDEDGEDGDRPDDNR